MDNSALVRRRDAGRARLDKGAAKSMPTKVKIALRALWDDPHEDLASAARKAGMHSTTCARPWRKGASGIGRGTNAARWSMRVLCRSRSRRSRRGANGAVPPSASWPTS